MSLIIKDGTGTGSVVEVGSNNRLKVEAIQQTAVSAATEKGNSYNLNTGSITLTSGGESAVMYVKNTDSTKNLVVSSVIIGLGPSASGSSAEVVKIKFIKNPTAGTIVDDATAVDMNSNRNYGSSKSLSADVYKGAEGKTLSDGSDHILVFSKADSRTAIPVDELLPNGSSLGFKIDALTSNTSMDCYVAVVCHLEDI